MITSSLTNLEYYDQVYHSYILENALDVINHDYKDQGTLFIKNLFGIAWYFSKYMEFNKGLNDELNN